VLAVIIYFVCSVRLVTNYVRVTIGKPEESIHEYRVSFSPRIDNFEIRKRFLIKHGRSVMGESRMFDGTILFLPKELPEKVKDERIVMMILFVRFWSFWTFVGKLIIVGD
jgi:hypothetical protein